MQPIFLAPVFHQTIWGGNRLHRDFGYDVPGDGIGECWAISSHPNGDCAVVNPEYAGQTLSMLWEGHRELFGNHPADRFPLLVKLIDAADDLSIQVHPDDDYARKYESGAFGKTECWYILDCEENAEIIIGHNAKDRKELEEMIRSGRWNELIRRIPVHKGDFFQIDPGCLHSIKGGTLLLETQQNSDITYRVYDYDRLSNGRPRELHLEKSIDVIKAPYVPASLQQTTVKKDDYELVTLNVCAYYAIQKMALHGSASFLQDKPFRNVSVVEGEGLINDIPIGRGSHFILPSGFGKYTLSGTMTLLSSFVP